MITVRLPDDLRDRIDAVRGDVPRERWVRRALEAAVGGGSTGEQHPGPSGSSQVAGSTPARPASPRAPAPKPEVPYELPKIAKRKW